LEVEELIGQIIVELLAKDVTVVSVANATQKFLDGVKNLGKGPFFAISLAMEVKATYRGCQIEALCTCIAAMWVFAKDVAARSIAVDSAVLEPLWCENGLVPRQREKINVQIVADVVADSKASRAACRGLVDPSVATGESIRFIVRLKKPFLQQVDSGFRVEHSFYEFRWRQGRVDGTEKDIGAIAEGGREAFHRCRPPAYVSVG
jgi:hypothetical protein